MALIIDIIMRCKIYRHIVVNISLNLPNGAIVDELLVDCVIKSSNLWQIIGEYSSKNESSTFH